MQTVDVVLSCFLAYAFIKGFWKGFFYEMASFVSLALGIYMAIYFSDFLKTQIETRFDYHASHVNLVAFVGTFIAVVVGISFLAKFFTQVSNFAALGILNKLLGGLFGGLKMLLFLSVILNLFMKLNKNQGLLAHKKVSESKLIMPIVEGSQDIYPLLHEWFPEVMEIKEEFKKAI